MPEDQIQDVDIIAEMMKATQYKPEAAAPNTFGMDGIQPALPGTTHSEDDFAPPPPEPAPEPEKTEEINAEDLTDLIIQASDILIESTFPYMYKQSMRKDDLKALTAIAREYRRAKLNRTKEIVLDAEAQEKMELYIDYEDFTESLPLTEKEKNRLRDPLRKVLGKINFTATPENALTATAAMVLLPRLLPLVRNKFS